MEIVEFSERPDLIERGIQFYIDNWANDSNFMFYQDCILNSLNPDNLLPKFYLLLDNDQIIGSYALLRNDLVSRQDITPWFACLYVNADQRNKGLAELLLNHGVQEAKAKGFNTLYLITDLVNYYERKGWNYLGVGYGITGSKTKIYYKSTI